MSPNGQQWQPQWHQKVKQDDTVDAATLCASAKGYQYIYNSARQMLCRVADGVCPPHARVREQGKKAEYE